MGNNRDYEVGYRRPPQDKRFAKGRSGNPKGRPRRSSTLANRLLQALSESVVVTEQGQRKTISKVEAMFKQLANKGAAGDGRAMQLLLAQLRAAEAGSDTSEDDGREGVAEQLVMLERLTVDERIEFRRLLAKAQGDPEPSGGDESNVGEAVPPTGRDSST